MWKIVRAETRYNSINFVVFLAIVPLLHAMQAGWGSSSGRAGGYAALLSFIMAMLMVNGWSVRHIREKRDYELAQLPLSVKKVAAARILMVMLPLAVFVAWYVGLQVAFPPRAHVNIRVPVMIWGLLVMAYSLAFIFRDRFIGTKALMRGKVLLVGTLGVLLIVNLWAMMAVDRAGARGEARPWIIKVFDFVERHKPTTSNLNMMVWLAVSLVLAYLTIETYVRRRSHV
jgi:hypothetical protein